MCRISNSFLKHSFPLFLQGYDTYPAFSKCMFRINPKDASGNSLVYPVELTVDYNVEQGYDYVKFYDGNDANSPLLGSYSGSGKVIVTSTNSSIYMEMISDDIIHYSGFKATYRIVKVGTVLLFSVGIE